MELAALLDRAAVRPHNLASEELAQLLSLEKPDEVAALHQAARKLKLAKLGSGVALRGLVEIGNRCAKDCYYCGIRSSNKTVERYQLSVDEVVSAAQLVYDFGYASLALQSGEMESTDNTEYIAEILERIAPLKLGVTLSLGEQREEVFARWRQLGAARYLLRIETSDEQLYAKLHPATHSYARRVECLRSLAQLGYQLGTGVMIGLPGQDINSLAHDIIFFKTINADMIGMGPYIPHVATPLAQTPVDTALNFRLALNMIAVTRLYLHDVNIAATTALQALAPEGRERGILAGANVIMPNVTPLKCRTGYQLYAGKPNLDENIVAARTALDESLSAIGEHVLYHQRGDAPHHARRMANL